MDSIVGNLMGMLGKGENLSALSKSVGGDEKSVSSALGMGLPMIMSAMSNKASTPGGLDSLTKMLTKAGDGNVMDDVGGAIKNPDAAGGKDMLSGLMGGQLSSITDMISKKTGLPAAAIGTVLSTVAPMVMGSVGKMFTEQKMDAKGLTAFLGDQSKMAMDGSPEAADITKQLQAAAQQGGGGFWAKLKRLFKG
jgi:hypothetical protein